MIDEFDNIFSENKKEVLELFKFMKEKYATAFIGISNTIELLKTLTHKYKIKLPEIKNIVFKPYNQNELS